MPILKVVNEGTPVKVWSNDIDDNALEQLKEISKVRNMNRFVYVIVPFMLYFVPNEYGVELGYWATYALLLIAQLEIYLLE